MTPVQTTDVFLQECMRRVLQVDLILSFIFLALRLVLCSTYSISPQYCGYNTPVTSRIKMAVQMTYFVAFAIAVLLSFHDCSSFLQYAQASISDDN